MADDPFAAELARRQAGGNAAPPAVAPADDPFAAELAKRQAAPAPAAAAPEQPGFFSRLLDPTQYQPEPGSLYPRFVEQGVVKGARDAAQGLITLPADLARALGFPNAADAITPPSLPEVPADGPAAQILGGAIQYGVPAVLGGGVAAAGARALPEVAPFLPRAVAGAARWLAPPIAAGATDAAVTDPKQAATLGDLVTSFTGGGIHPPTSIDPGDSNMTRRLKVGIEGGVGGAIMDAGAAGGRGLGALLGTEGTERTVAGAMQRQAFPDLEASIFRRPEARSPAEQATLDAARGDIAGDIRSTTDRLSGLPNFVPTTGTASGDPRLIALERGVSTDPEYIRNADLQRSAAAAPIQDLAATGGDPAALAAAVRQPAEAASGAATTRLANTEAALRQAEADLEARGQSLGARAADKTSASQGLHEQVMGAHDTLRGEARRLYDAIDPEGSVAIDVTPLARAARAARQAEGDLSSGITERVNQYAGATLRRIDDAMQSQLAASAPDGVSLTMEGVPPRPPANFRELQQVRTELSDAIGKARRDGAGDVVGRLVPVREAVDDYVNQLADLPNEVGQRAQDARSFYRDELSPRFRQGEGGAMAMAIRRDQQPGKQLKPSATADRFLRSGQGSLEPAQDLQRIISAAPNPAAARDSVRQYLVADLAENATRGGKLNPTAMERWIANRRDVLATYPDIRTEVQQLRNQVRSGVDRVNQLGEDVRAAREGVQQTQREQANSAARLFLNDQNPVDAVKKVLESDRSDVLMDQLVSAAAADPSGEATQGLKQAVGEALNQRMTTAGRTLGGDAKASQAKLESLSKNARLWGTLGKVLSPAELDGLENARAALQVMDRINIKATSNSDTALNLASIDNQKIQSLLAASYGIVKGRGIATVLKGATSAVSKLPLLHWLDQSEAAKELLKQAMIDPELGARLMTLDARPNVVRLRTYLINNYPEMFTPPADRQDDRR